MKRALFCLLSTILFFDIAPLWAQSAEEIEEFETFIAQGQENLEQGLFHEAYASFLRAEELFSHPALSLQIGLASARSGRCEIGRRRLSELRDSELSPNLQARLASIEEHLDNCISTGRLHLECHPDTATGKLGDEVIPCNEEIDIPSGEQEILVHHPTYQEELVSIHIEEGEEHHQMVDLLPLEELREDPAPIWMAPTAFVLGGGGLLTLGSGLFIDSRAISRQDDIREASLQGNTTEVDELEAHSVGQRRLAGILYAAGATMVVSGAALYWLNHRIYNSDTNDFNAWLAPSASGVTLNASW